MRWPFTVVFLNLCKTNKQTKHTPDILTAQQIYSSNCQNVPLICISISCERLFWLFWFLIQIGWTIILSGSVFMPLTARWYAHMSFHSPIQSKSLPANTVATVYPAGVIWHLEVWSKGTFFTLPWGKPQQSLWVNWDLHQWYHSHKSALILQVDWKGVWIWQC